MKAEQCRARDVRAKGMEERRCLDGEVEIASVELTLD